MSKKRSTEGFIYIISNSNFPDFYKIGVTTDISKRLRTYQTSSPHRNFKVEHYIKHPDCYLAEQKIRENMKHFAKSIKNEWYEIPLWMAVTRLQEIAEEEEKVPVDNL